jgi:hypothetical protein
MSRALISNFCECKNLYSNKLKVEATINKMIFSTRRFMSQLCFHFPDHVNEVYQLKIFAYHPLEKTCRLMYVTFSTSHVAGQYTFNI